LGNRITEGVGGVNNEMETEVLSLSRFKQTFHNYSSV
jgi:hypothetical protein